METIKIDGETVVLAETTEEIQALSTLLEQAMIREKDAHSDLLLAQAAKGAISQQIVLTYRKLKETQQSTNEDSVDHSSEA